MKVSYYPSKEIRFIKSRKGEKKIFSAGGIPLLHKQSIKSFLRYYLRHEEFIKGNELFGIKGECHGHSWIPSQSLPAYSTFMDVQVICHLTLDSLVTSDHGDMGSRPSNDGDKDSGKGSNKSMDIKNNMHSMGIGMGSNMVQDTVAHRGTVQLQHTDFRYPQ